MTEQEKKQRVTIYVDGSNLYHKLKDLKIQNTTYFDYAGLCDYLSRGRQITSKRYYVGTVRVKGNDLKAIKLRKNQQKLFESLKKQGLVIKEGVLMVNNGQYREKGVDVKIAVELLIGAYENY